MRPLQVENGLPEVQPAADGRVSVRKAARERSGSRPAAPDPVARRLVELIEENAQLKEAIQARPVVDQARGVLMAAMEGTADEAWQVLRETSQHANVRLREVAVCVIASAGGRPLPAHLQTHVHRAMDQVRWDRRSGRRAG